MLLNYVISLLIASAVLSFTHAQEIECAYQTSNLEGNISYPEFSYGSSRTCGWNITVPVEYDIHLRIIRFSVPGTMDSCTDGYGLFISGRERDTSSVFSKTLCGFQELPKVLYFRNTLYISYHYYYYGERYSYFTLEYRAVPANISSTTAKWISENEDTLLNLKESLPKALPALRLFNETYFTKHNMTGYKFKTEYLLKLSTDLIRNHSRRLTAADLSHHVLALLAVCSNPSSFHGIDLVHRLRRAVDEYSSLSSPFNLLTLCSAGEKLTSVDIEQLHAVLRAENSNMYLLDFQAISIMALVCADKQNEELSVDYNHTLAEALQRLTSYQRKDGSFGSLQSTVLIVQALSAAGAEMSRWNETLALRFIQSKNHSDGSFGNIYDLYTVLPVLSGKNLLDINARKCNFSPKGISPLQEVKDKITDPISLTYELWVDDGSEFKYTISLKFPNGTKFFDVMRLAGEKDEKFHLKWTFTKGDLYVYEIAGYINDPTGGKYWSLYIFNGSNELVPFKKRLETYIPSDGDTVVMWYKTVNLQEILP